MILQTNKLSDFHSSLCRTSHVLEIIYSFNLYNLRMNVWVDSKNNHRVFKRDSIKTLSLPVFNFNSEWVSVEIVILCIFHNEALFGMLDTYRGLKYVHSIVYWFSLHSCRSKSQWSFYTTVHDQRIELSCKSN